MKIISLTVGSLQTNCYLVSDSDNNCIIIDPGDEADFISTTIIENKYNPLAILLTHGHFDHCLATLELKINFQIPIYLHQNDSFLYNNASNSADYWSKISTNPPKLPKIDKHPTNSETIKIGKLEILVIHTSGHTPGSCCFLIDHYLFTGDTLFSHNRVGATNHSYSSKSDLQNSISKIKSLIAKSRKQIQIYPGHEEFGFTTSPSLF